MVRIHHLPPSHSAAVECQQPHKIRLNKVVAMLKARAIVRLAAFACFCVWRFRTLAENIQVVGRSFLFYRAIFKTPGTVRLCRASFLKSPWLPLRRIDGNNSLSLSRIALAVGQAVRSVGPNLN